MPKGTFSVSADFAGKHDESTRQRMMISVRTEIAAVLGKGSIGNVTLAEPPAGGGSGLPHVLIEMNEMGPKYAALFQVLPPAIAGAIFVEPSVFDGLPTNRHPLEISVNFRGVGKYGARFNRMGFLIGGSEYTDPMLEALGTGLMLRDEHLNHKRRAANMTHGVDVGGS